MALYGNRELPRAGGTRTFIQGGIKDGGNLTSICEEQSLAALRNRPVGAQTSDEMRILRREPELHTGRDHRLWEGQRDHPPSCFLRKVT